MTSKTYAVAVLIAVTATAWVGNAFATQPGNNGGGNGGCGVGQQTNGCGSTGGSATGGSANASAGAVGVGVGIGYGQGGAGGDAKAYGGAGGSANVLGSGNSSVKNENNNANIGINGQQQQQSNSSSNSNSVSGYGGSATGNGAGNSTSVNFEGSTYKEAAQTAYAPTPTGPRNSCRIFVGLGGSSVNGSLSGGIPLANDQTCISGAQVEFMQTVNKIKPGTFSVDDYLAAVCAVEGMDKMQACKK